jgi:hypothetical protein
MKFLFAVATFALGMSWTAQTGSGPSIMPQAAAHTRDAMALKCRKAVFRAYGHRKVEADGRRVRTLNRDFVVRQVDACVANGGRVR